jgi:hypothetical protein
MARSVTATYEGGFGEAQADESTYCGQKKITLTGLGAADSARNGVVFSPLLSTIDKREDEQLEHSVLQTVRVILKNRIRRIKNSLTARN